MTYIHIFSVTLLHVVQLCWLMAEILMITTNTFYHGKMYLMTLCTWQVVTSEIQMIIDNYDLVTPWRNVPNDLVHVAGCLRQRYK
jgi:hypothetical protein